MCIIDALRTWFASCPLLKDGLLNVERLGAEPVEYSLIQDSTAKLSSVSFTGLSGYLAPAFSSNTFVYTAQVEDAASSVSVLINKPASVTYSITVNGAAVSGNSIPLDQTENNVHITAVNGAQSVVYTFIITKVTESDSNAPSVYSE